MFATSESDINVDQLMQEIRETVARRSDTQTIQSRRDSSRGSTSLKKSSSHPAGIQLGLQPIFQRHPDDHYHVNDLLKYHGHNFIHNAYKAILKREPDATGMSEYVARLADGKLNKIDVLASLRYSPEGKRAGVMISGLRWPATVRQVARIPVIGYALQVGIAVARLPVMLTGQRQFEFYSLARQEQIVDYTNGLRIELNERAAELNARAAEMNARASTIESNLGDLHKAFHQHQAETWEKIATAKKEMGDIQLGLQRLADRISETIAEQKTTQVNWRREFESLASAHQRLGDEIAAHQRRLHELIDIAQVQASFDEKGLDELYASFEDQFRGEAEEIKNRLRAYLPVLEGANVTADILDVGCGRGEWLELLRESGRKARGVDDNRIFIERCQLKGLDVVKRDAIAFISDLPTASLNAITSFHLVEHLPFRVLLKLLDEMVRVLRPGSPLILETPNPENLIVGSHTFYSDPTHRHPIPSGTLQFLLEARGLSGIEVMQLRPWVEARIAGDDELTKRFNEYFYGSPDYGIVGWKI